MAGTVATYQSKIDALEGQLSAQTQRETELLAKADSQR